MSKFTKLEKERGKPLKYILVEELNEHLDVPTVATNIKISYRHVLRKVQELGIQPDPPHWTLPEEREHAV